MILNCPKAYLTCNESVSTFSQNLQLAIVDTHSRLQFVDDTITKTLAWGVEIRALLHQLEQRVYLTKKEVGADVLESKFPTCGLPCSAVDFVV